MIVSRRAFVAGSLAASGSVHGTASRALAGQPIMTEISEHLIRVQDRPLPGNVPPLSNFGHSSMKHAGRSALGRRNLIAVLCNYTEFPPLVTQHPLAYHRSLAYSNPKPPFSTNNPINPASLKEFFLENSSGRFVLEEPKVFGVVGPISMGANNTGGSPEERTARIVKKLGETFPGIFAELDVDKSGTLSSAELSVMLFENIKPYWPGNRVNNPVSIMSNVGGVQRTTTVSVNWAGAGPLTPFYQMAHELSHSFGTLDMYNTGASNRLMTLMGAYSFDSNDQATVHLDIWHKLLLGWAEPQVFALRSGGNAFLRTGATGGVILWDEQREREYFILERRRPDAPGLKYDANFPANGVVVWRVGRDSMNRPSVGTLAAPDLKFGGSGVWVGGQTTPPLVWSDGQSSRVTCSFRPAAQGAMVVNWRAV